MIYKKILFYFTICIILQSCFSIKPLKFKQADNFNIQNPLSASPDVHFEMVFENPNGYGCTIKAIETGGNLKGKNIFNYKTEKSIHIKRKSEFVIPVDMTMPMDNLMSVLPSAINLFKNKEAVPFQLSGSITLRKFLFKKTFPFSWKDQSKN